MKIAILGYGKQGKAAYDYWQTAENKITVCDNQTSLNLPSNIETQLGKDYLNNLDRFDVIVRSPAVHPRDIAAANGPNILDKVTTVTNEFFRVCPTKKIIGITGTKGKGTTSTLISKLLGSAGKNVHLGGNIGTPPLDLLKNGIKPEDWVVLELANFQLIDLKYSPHIAVCLMVVPEHLDWHVDFEEYIKAKVQLFINQSNNDIAIYYAQNAHSQKIASVSPGRKIPYYAPPGCVVESNQFSIDGQKLCAVSELRLLGKHNWQNVCAAITAVWQISHSTEAFRSVLINFSGLEHRLEPVRIIDGITYYNDSFAATPDAAIAALNAIPGHKVMIMGGFDRNLPIEHLAKAIASKEQQIRKVILIGASAKRLGEHLDSAGFTNYIIEPSTSMTNIVLKAQENAKDGDAIVLSPGFASFDMFKNFEDRGLQFKRAVGEI